MQAPLGRELPADPIEPAQLLAQDRVGFCLGHVAELAVPFRPRLFHFGDSAGDVMDGFMALVVVIVVGPVQLFADPAQSINDLPLVSWVVVFLVGVLLMLAPALFFLLVALFVGGQLALLLVFFALGLFVLFLLGLLMLLLGFVLECLLRCFVSVFVVVGLGMLLLPMGRSMGHMGRLVLWMVVLGARLPQTQCVHCERQGKRHRGDSPHGVLPLKWFSRNSHHLCRCCLERMIFSGL